jgi:phage terminase large subunit-like protein
MINWQKTAEQFKGRVATGGIDLSAVKDLTCWAVMFPDPKDADLVDVLVRSWCPESRLYDKSNKYRDQYQAWAKQGYLEVTPGDAIDYDFVRERIFEDCRVFRVGTIAVDRLFQGYEFSQKLDLELGGREHDPKVIPCGMGYYSMAGLMQEFERRLLERKLNHGGNPILRFMADSMSVSMDPAGNLKPNKATSQGKIDGIIAVLLALDRLMRTPPVKVRMPLVI